ncbi:MAG: flavodoxin family protein [Synergistaceae bacterium]|nr:flavodoxin family protein [Synergistaceae bacterium]
MNILVLNGSPRPNGNTANMISAFRAGAEGAGQHVDVVDICKKKIAGCLACEHCHTKGNGSCVQKDDMQEVYALLKNAEMLVIASPIYYHGISGQLKCCIDRFYSAAYPAKPAKLKKAAMILSSGDANMYDGALFSFKGDFLDYLGLANMGVYTAHGSENDSPKKLEELKAFGASLKD